MGAIVGVVVLGVVVMLVVGCLGYLVMKRNSLCLS